MHIIYDVEGVDDLIISTRELAEFIVRERITKTGTSCINNYVFRLGGNYNE